MIFLYHIKFKNMDKLEYWQYDSKTGRLCSEVGIVHIEKGLIASNWIVQNYDCEIVDCIEI